MAYDDFDTPETPAWASDLADELAGFEPLPPASETGSARAARERREATERQRKSRERRKRLHELDSAIANAIGHMLRRGGAYERIKASGFGKMSLRVEWLFGEAVSILVDDYGWPKKAAARALNKKLLLP